MSQPDSSIRGAIGSVMPCAVFFFAILVGSLATAQESQTQQPAPAVAPTPEVPPARKIKTKIDAPGQAVGEDKTAKQQADQSAPAVAKSKAASQEKQTATAKPQSPTTSADDDRLSRIEKQLAELGELLQAMKTQTPESAGDPQAATPKTDDKQPSWDGELSKDWLKGIRWRSIGPANMGGRITPTWPLTNPIQVLGGRRRHPAADQNNQQWN